ncbi:MAG: hypothetical protein MI919_09885 [Holophagales bacterium]|nr:hypothetical protein [Holophagales bacterium]
MSAGPLRELLEAGRSQAQPRVFRSRAVDHYRQGRKRKSQPEALPPALFRLLWLGVLAAAWLSWRIAGLEIPVVVEGPAWVGAGPGNHGPAIHVLVPADAALRPTAGQELELLEAGKDEGILGRGTIEGVSTSILSAAQGRASFGGPNPSELVLDGPQVSISALFHESPEPAALDSRQLRARITLGHRSLASHLPWVREGAGRGEEAAAGAEGV